MTRIRDASTNRQEASMNDAPQDEKPQPEVRSAGFDVEVDAIVRANASGDKAAVLLAAKTLVTQAESKLNISAADPEERTRAQQSGRARNFEARFKPKNAEPTPALEPLPKYDGVL